MENLQQVGKASDTVLRVLEAVSPGPRRACLVLAVALGRLAERCGMSLDLLSTVVRDAARASAEVESHATRWGPAQRPTA